MTKHIKSIEATCSKSSPRISHAWCKKVLFNMFADLRFGKLTIDNCGKVYEFGELYENSGIAASAVIHDTRFYLDVLFKGSLGAAESYMTGY